MGQYILSEIKPIDLVQTIGILVGFLLSWHQIRVANRLAKFRIFWQIGESHHAVWSPLVDDESLSRILKSAPDLIAEPISDKERAFLNNLFIHLEGTFEADRQGYYRLGPHEKIDIADLLHLPIPQKVWRELRVYQPPRFVAFIDKLVTGKKKSVWLIRQLITTCFTLWNRKGSHYETSTQDQ